MEKQNTPKLRFSSFTDPWEQRMYGDLADYKKGPFGSAITKDMFVPKSEESVKVYEQQNAINKDWSLERYFLPKKYALTKLKSFEVHGGDIIVSCAGTIGEIYEIPVDAENGVINQALMRVRVNESIVDKKMFTILFSNMIDDFTRSHSNGSAIKNIPPFSDLKPMEALIPTIKEQRRIGAFFDGLDHLIILHQRKCDQVKTLKKAMLQKMFPKEGETTPEIRFPGFTGPWEQHKLSEIADKYDNLRVPVAASERVPGSTPYYGANGIQDYVDGYTHDGEFVLIAEDGANDLKNYPVQYTTGKIWVNNHAHVLQGKEKITENKFLGYSINATNIESLLVGGGRAKLNAEVMMGIELLMPSYREQCKISEFLFNLDNLIALHQRKCDELKELKKGLLQQMLV